MNRTRLFAALVALISTPMLAGSPLHAEGAELSAEDRQQLDEALRLGTDIFRYDQAAWHTTDAMVEDIGDPAKVGIRGWVIDEIDGTLKVIYFRVDDGVYRPAYSASYDGNTVGARMVHGADSDPLEPRLVEQAEARLAPSDFQFMRCSKQAFNTVVLPSGKPNGGHYVYYLVPQPDLETIAFGGNYRFEVVDGKVIADRTFTRSCISLGAAAGSKGEKLAAMTISHLLDPVPTELHVFAVYTARIPIFVLTTDSNLLWEIGVTEGTASARIVRRM